eukprot:CAMPEP_0183453084 /NCGR_PEP_ID=MMETSP0370-20130417/119981_1 /TAXON_ID=268820 /ORGANISM="Peridinium aciculiferum, Strain PAER-2" /LENGTH=63 /DNA_ID=CAMNT_0025644447 /DNA_START=42 /DNA_END=230 /DNA_ORIENTATION=-
MVEYDSQDVGNTAWSFAKLGIYHEPLMQSISAQARLLLLDFCPQNLTNLAWALATLSVSDVAL